MVYCDGSFVWKPELPHRSKGGAGTMIMHKEHVLQYERLGLGSTTHSRDAELWALLTAINLLIRNPPATYVQEVVLISDAALALKQLRHTRPEPGHEITKRWHTQARVFLSANPHVNLHICWGPAKSTLCL